MLFLEVGCNSSLRPGKVCPIRSAAVPQWQHVHNICAIKAEGRESIESSDRTGARTSGYDLKMGNIAEMVAPSVSAL